MGSNSAVGVAVRKPFRTGMSNAVWAYSRKLLRSVLEMPPWLVGDGESTDWGDIRTAAVVFGEVTS